MHVHAVQWWNQSKCNQHKSIKICRVTLRIQRLQRHQHALKEHLCSRDMNSLVLSDSLSAWCAPTVPGSWPCVSSVDSAGTISEKEVRRNNITKREILDSMLMQDTTGLSPQHLPILSVRCRPNQPLQEDNKGSPKPWRTMLRLVGW